MKKDDMAVDKGVLHAGGDLLEGDEGEKMRGNDLPGPENGVASGKAYVGTYHSNWARDDAV